MHRAEEIVNHIRADRRDLIRVYWDSKVPAGPHEDRWGFGLTNKPEVSNPAGNVAKKNYKFPMQNLEEARQVFTGICDILRKPELVSLFSTKNVDSSKPVYMKVQVD
jgi:hypothetical protein